MEATEDDEVFHWGREVDVKWGMLTWVTFRDQASLFLRPLHLDIIRLDQCGTDNIVTLTNGPRSTMGLGRTRALSIINVPPLRFIPRISHRKRQISRRFRWIYS